MKTEKYLYFLSMKYQQWHNPVVDLYALDLKNILIVKWDEIGDMAAALHVFELIKESHPNCNITLVCKSFVKPLIVSNPFIDEIFTDFSKVNFKQKFDCVIDLRGTQKSLKKCIAKKPRVYLGRGIVRYRNKGNQKHEQYTNYDIIAPILKPSKPPVAPKIYLNNGLLEEINTWKIANNTPKYVVMHTQARAALRQWPMERFAKTAHHLKEKHQLITVLVGATEEIPQITERLNLFPPETKLFEGADGLLSFAALCAQAALFIGNESGPLQLAATFIPLPIIALFGPGVPDVFYPIGANKKVLHYVEKCNPCDQITCSQPENKCIDMIQEIEVIQLLDELLKK